MAEEIQARIQSLSLSAKVSSLRVEPSVGIFPVRIRKSAAFGRRSIDGII
jgi:hypothetical protein